VELIAFTPDGRCMATIERQAKAQGLAEESRLKFWFQDPNTQKYVGGWDAIASQNLGFDLV
jgi:hypothetical protein